MKYTLEPGNRLIEGTLLENGHPLCDGVAVLNPDGTGTFQVAESPPALRAEAAHCIEDGDGQLWPLATLSVAGNEGGTQYNLTHTIEFSEVTIEE